MDGLTLMNNAYVAVSCENTETIVDNIDEQTYQFSNILANGDNKNYTMEIVFNNNGNATETNRGLIGTGKYSNYFSDDEWYEFITNLSYENKFNLIQNEYKKKFGYYPFKEGCATNGIGIDFQAEDFTGQTNALKINAANNGLISSYGGKLNSEEEIVLKTDNVLDTGIHTATITCDGVNTKIYIDGELKTYSTNVPDIQQDVEFTVGATERTVEVKLYSNGNAFQSSSRGRISYQIRYEEFLNDTVYSVRVYDRALTEAEINYNYQIDASRFISQ